MKNFGYVTLLVSVFFIACGDDVTSNTYVQSPIVAIEEGAELPACSMENDGTMTFVPDEGVIYFCYDGNWNPLKGKDGVDGEKGDKGDKGADGKNGTNGLNGLNGESCDVVAVEDGFNIVCGDTVKGTVKNGSDGEDGTSCTAKDTTDTDGLKGLNVICGEKQVGTIWNGKDGPDGDDGKSCDAVESEGGYNIVCGGVVKGFLKEGTDGEDGASCTAKDTTDTDGLKGLNVICGEKQVGTIWNGKDGSDGEDGKSCDAVATEGGYNIVCGGVVKGFLKEGTDGEDGASCTARDTTDTDGLKGFNVICGEKQVGTIWNGKDGSDGEDGKSCDAVAVEGGYNIVCGGVVKGFVRNEYGMSSSSIGMSTSSSSVSSTAIQTGDDLTGSVYDSQSNTLIDLRDGQSYNTIVIGSQVWMAENLNYDYSKDGDNGCYGKVSLNCEKYGRLYIWSGAKLACPAGWHLPSKSQFQTLIDAVGGGSFAGSKLKSAIEWNGTDLFGFSALPAGKRENGVDADKNSRAYFWTSTKVGNDDPYYMYLEYAEASFGYRSEYANQISGTKVFAYSVRCLKD